MTASERAAKIWERAAAELEATCAKLEAERGILRDLVREVYAQWCATPRGDGPGNAFVDALYALRDAAGIEP